MSKIVLYLSGTWAISAPNLVGADDLVLYASGLKPPIGPWKSKELPKIPIGYERLITDLMVQKLSIGEPDASVNLIECFLNDFYSYSIRPLVAAIFELKDCIEKTGFSDVLVLTVNSRSARIPMVGFRTSESLRGSPNLLMARLANFLPRIFPEIKFNFKYTRGDIFCIEFLRRFGIGVANVLFFLKFAYKLIAINRRSKEEFSDFQINSIILVRTIHQMRFAQRLLNDSSSLAVAIFPQVSQGSLSDLETLVASLPNNVLFCRIKVSMLLKAFSRSVVDVAKLRRSARRWDDASCVVCGVMIPVRLGDLADDIRLVSTVVFYKNILSQLLRSVKPDRLINFELVGRMAGLEALAARENSVEACTVQSALITSAPHPVFPYCERFYADSAITRELIEGNGSKVKGKVVYEGSPYPVRGIQKIDSVRRIAFFTQPYELESTLSILSVLCDWAISHAATITIRLHPRDRLDHYGEVLRRFSSTLHHEHRMDLMQVIETHDLCVTRTSSVAKEALALGAPILLCLWSNFDRNVKADYIVDSPGLGYCARSAAGLISLLNDPHSLARSAETLWECMFAGKTLNDLTKNLLR